MKLVGLKEGLAILALGSLIVGCGGSSSSSRSSAAAAGVTSGTTTLDQARAEHTAVLLPSGDILVAGGLDVSLNPMATTVIITRRLSARKSRMAVCQLQCR